MRQFVKAPLWGSQILPESVVIHVRWRSHHPPSDSCLSALTPMRTESITVPWVVTSPKVLWAIGIEQVQYPAKLKNGYY